MGLLYLYLIILVGNTGLYLDQYYPDHPGNRITEGPLYIALGFRPLFSQGTDLLLTYSMEQGPS